LKASNQIVSYFKYFSRLLSCRLQKSYRWHSLSHG